MTHFRQWRQLLTLGLLALLPAGTLLAQKPQPKAKAKPAAKPAVRYEDLAYPPVLPGGAKMVTDKSPKFLEAPESLRPGVTVAKAVPTVDFMFFPEQTYLGDPWSNWGDGSFANGKYYSAIGDHIALNRKKSSHGTGTAYVYEYDPATKKLRTLVDVSKLLAMPEGHYTPGKVHTRVDLGSDGWLYYATHRGSPRAAVDENHYKGDWIFRTNPETGKSEVVATAPVPKHSIPNGMLDRKRLIYYGGTAAGPDAEEQEIQFLAYDLEKHKVLYSGGIGPARAMILAESTGRVYYVPGAGEGELMRYDPASGKGPEPTGKTMNTRATTTESSDGMVYGAALGQGTNDCQIWSFNTKTETPKNLGEGAVGVNAYIAAVALDPSTNRYLYYVPGAHGGGERDNSAVVQFDLKTGKKKVIAFLHPFYEEKYGFICKGTYSTDVSDDGSQLFITYNVSRGTRAWDCCGLVVVHIPESERQP
ncbi:hypothetical protein [Lignipirellula cremea]|uniref:Uncharacterized protein n=1 Tax=Lignipirellula cremea TaxID=2528010 RepID=A0A518DZC9_9BACT|nr:hypothetical protein [Lignipirellula cremea]QDU97194.1 hypothetical protein Pla8534_50390 [Lignipirellula cremea]